MNDDKRTVGNLTIGLEVKVRDGDFEVANQKIQELTVAASKARDIMAEMVSMPIGIDVIMNSHMVREPAQETSPEQRALEAARIVMGMCDAHESCICPNRCPMLVSMGGGELGSARFKCALSGDCPAKWDKGAILQDFKTDEPRS